MTFATNLPDTALASLSVSAVQTATSAIPLGAAGSIILSLEPGPTAAPFLTSIGAATATLPLANASAYPSLGPTANATPTPISVGNIFQMIDIDAPPAQITPTGDHPVAPLGIHKQQDRLETNKFYANFFLGDQMAGTWTHPYSVSYGNGSGESSSWGLVISHTERDQFGTTPAEAGIDAGKIKNFASPVGLQPLVLSAAELGNGTKLTTDSLEAFSVNVNLAAPNGTNVLTFPLLQGMGFVTGVYNDGTPLIQSGVGITSLVYCGPVDNYMTYKYRASVGASNGSDSTWLIYVTPSEKSYKPNSFTLLDAKNVQGRSNFNGYIQIAKVPTDGGNRSELVYDAAAGVYPTSASISGSVSGQAGTYTLKWTKAGDTSRTLLMWALPHHVQSFSSATARGLKNLKLITTTKGYATAVSGDSWTLEEPNLPIDLGFAPWSPETGSVKSVSSATIELLNAVAYAELNEDIETQTNTSSIYYDGKALAKFATICYTANTIAKNSSLAISGLKKLQEVFALHVDNVMPIPIVYDDVWGGIVSVCSYKSGDTGCDFGNTYYNDHHFHYGYYVYAAAVIGYLNSSWLDAGTNKAWVNTLVRDYANSITDDPYFPFARMFDWYHGHSWAHGISAAADGKDQESSSEDTMASYAIKQWGHVIKDVNMEARGNLMLAIHARSLQNYYLYTDDNTVQPADFIGNKVAGILFENKVDHVTYFGDVPAYIQGIHMLPLLPHTPLIRTKTFVQEEWEAYFANDTGISPVWNITGGWRGIIKGNQMFIDPTASFDFFSGSSFNTSYLDNGASQTWYLAYSAALGGDAGTSSKNKREKVRNLVNQVSGKVI
ncbi:endo-1,3-beta-glucanase [Teratosphaeria nubilosa]|uniref:glucan endo-1,3-beta-D-glucosidase n=1 Tax=Teratosphaeria nubilosa TaxID=161662 RepID=A0A6G1LD93_9PEZI|nr:endo-1,3-beta-glucanase [Teratosphaeria nubilosa]